MIDMIQYKANLAGISVIRTNESYTSQTSALDHEKPCWENGSLANADINGALQIIRKVFPKFSLDEGIADAVMHPVKWSPLI